MLLAAQLVLLCSAISSTRAVTVFGQIPFGQTATPTDPNAPAQTTLAAYDKTELIPPPIPEDYPGSVAYTLSLEQKAASVNGLSIPHVGGGFWGFSIEMSVASQVLGKNSTFIQVPLLNLLSNIQERAGSVVIRVGGNTQEFATLVPADSHTNGHTFSKEDSGSLQTTKTPAVLYTEDMFYMASNISSLLNVKWFFGIPFNDSVNWRLQIAERSQAILGDNLLALQAANEPDFYQQFGRREVYNPTLYSNELEDLINTIERNPQIPRKNILLSPSVSGQWTPESVWSTGFMDRFKDHMYAFTVEHYPRDNCAAQFNTGAQVIDPQVVFSEYVTHTGPVTLTGQFTNSANLATAAGKPFMMFETNTASCGGFKGISDSYGAALWATDYGLQMASHNFTHAMMHVGGQNAFYNPFTSPPTNQSTFNQWTVGAVYYATIILAEAFGMSNQSRSIDLWGNEGSVLTPSYAIYDGEDLSKVALFNYVTDPTGAHDINVTITIPQGVPAELKVKYLLTAGQSVSSKTNITWAGQTLGEKLEVDGRFKGTLDVKTVPCDVGAKTCVVTVPAPGFALVFVNPQERELSIGAATKTFATTAHTRAHNTIVVNATLIATSNGHAAADNRNSLGSTSPGDDESSAMRTSAVAWLVALFTGIAIALVR